MYLGYSLLSTAYAIVAIPKSMQQIDANYWRKTILNLLNNQDFANDLEIIGLLPLYISGDNFNNWYNQQHNFYKKINFKYEESKT